MNERIKELIKQATTIEEHKWGVSYDNFDKEKFAELIVRECSRVIVNGGYWSGGTLGPKRQCTPPEIATMIKEHFGVEE
jgi:hypothetical protein